MRHWGKTRNTLLSLIAVSMMTSGCSVIMAASRSSYRGDVAVIKKVATAIGHLGADFFTLCLWEFVGTPYEIAVRDKVVTYHLQYSLQGTLTSIEKIKG